MHRTLTLACLFACTGGYLDAYSYLEHGHVFANAQTGNVILFGVFASGGEWDQALRHVPPIVAFILGVAVAALLGVRSKQDSVRATLACQALELVTLAILAMVDTRLPTAYVVPLISFVAAVQNSSFNKIGQWSFNSAMTTGNLRDATAAFIAWLMRQDNDQGRGKAIALGLICVTFLAGALAGGLVSRSSASHHLVPCVALVAVGMFMTWRARAKLPRPR